MKKNRKKILLMFLKHGINPFSRKWEEKVSKRFTFAEKQWIIEHCKDAEARFKAVEILYKPYEKSNYAKKIVAICTITAVLICNFSFAFAGNRKLSSIQQKRADAIAKVVSANWSKYGVLPSIAIAQALQETGLGTAYNNGNLWGICSGRVSYSSIEDGTYAYMKVINNGYYKDAPFQKNWRVQIRKILDGGYCQPEGEYYSNVCWLVENYNLDKYDKKMFADIEKRKLRKKQEKKRKKKWNHKYKIVYDADVPAHAIQVNINIIKKGTVCVYTEDGFEMLGIYDIESGSKGYVLRSSDESLAGKTVKLEVQENSKG